MVRNIIRMLGHRIRKGEKFPTRLTESEGDSILRKDLKEMCALFRHLGKDSLLLSEISDNIELSKPQHYPKNIVFYSVNHSVIG